MVREDWVCLRGVSPLELLSAPHTVRSDAGGQSRAANGAEPHYPYGIAPLGCRYSKRLLTGGHPADLPPRAAIPRGAAHAFTDVDGRHFQSFITNQDDQDIAALEARHRQHAEVEDASRR